MQSEFISMSVSIELIPLNQEEQDIHDLALTRASRHAASEAELLTSIEEIDRLRLYEKFGLPNIRPNGSLKKRSQQRDHINKRNLGANR